MNEAHVEFCGERFPVSTGDTFTIGRDADLAIDDNPFLHRHFLQIHQRDGLWWLSNVGGQLTATVSDDAGAFQAYLAPGSHMPFVFTATTVRFSAGATTYELSFHTADPVFDPPQPAQALAGETTVGVPALNHDQRLLLLALAECVLRRPDRSISELPSSQEAADRLGWSLTRFNRKLDYLCEKLSRSGIRGLHGRADQLASNRRFRLVEYALAVRLVTAEDLSLLPDLNRGIGEF